MNRAMQQAITAHSRIGLNVVVDVGHRDAFSKASRDTPRLCPAPERAAVLFVGVRCRIEIILERRRATWDAGHATDGSVPTAVSLWQQAVHAPGIYDPDVDTSVMNPEACADVIRQCLEHGPPPSAFLGLAAIAAR